MTKREHMRALRHQEQKRQRTITLAIVIIGALVIAGFLIYPSIKPVGNIATPAEGVFPNPQENHLGDPNAPVKVEVFEDFQCPYCRQYSEQVEQQIIKTYVVTNQVYYTYVPFSFLDDRSAIKESKLAAEAAFCASDQGKFWQFHDMVYANQTGENIGDFTERRLKAFAAKLKLDTATFNSCFSNGKYTQRVLDQRAYSESVGVTSSPSFTVNGKLITGSNELISAIEAALQGK
jgi:protein-disulfide isomerase